MNQVLSESPRAAAAGSLYEVAHWIGGRINLAECLVREHGKTLPDAVGW